MNNDPLANIFSAIMNAEKVGKRTVVVTPVSKTAIGLLKVMHENRYLGSTEETSKSRGGIAKVNLLGKINDCGIIKPRFAVKHNSFERFEKRYLPAKGVGIIVLSTPKGLMTHQEAKEKHTGGRLLAYCY